MIACVYPKPHQPGAVRQLTVTNINSTQFLVLCFNTGILEGHIHSTWRNSISVCCPVMSMTRAGTKNAAVHAKDSLCSRASFLRTSSWIQRCATTPGSWHAQVPKPGLHLQPPMDLVTTSNWTCSAEETCLCPPSCYRTHGSCSAATSFPRVLPTVHRDPVKALVQGVTVALQNWNVHRFVCGRHSGGNAEPAGQSRQSP